MTKERKICVSFPLNDAELNNIESSIIKAQISGANLFEFRFDYIKDPENIPKFIEIISKYRNKSIFTVRSKHEGGQFFETETKRIGLLKELCKVHPLFLDVEYELISNNEDFADFIESNNIRILLSWHNFKETPSQDQLLNLINKMIIYSNYIKIVTTSNNFHDCLNILKLYEIIGSKIKLVAFSMGEYGVITRILCSVVGDAPFTYATIGQPLAPGQLQLEQVKQFYSMLKNKLI